MFTILWGNNSYGEFATKTLAVEFLKRIGWSATDIDQTEFKFGDYAAEIIPILPRGPLAELPRKL